MLVFRLTRSLVYKIKGLTVLVWKHVLKRKRTEDLKGKATDRSADIIEDVFSSDIDKMEMDAEKENICDRFSFDTTVDELEKLMEGECPANTAKNNEWAYNNFESWRTVRNKQYPKMRCPEDLYHVMYSSTCNDIIFIRN